MYNFEKSIEEISNNFIKEAKNSPVLFRDMAKMEKYLAESYSNRIFIEMLQNADDALSEELSIKKIGKNLLFMNDGRPFNEDDINSICRSGASQKVRGNDIGYRGVGFKSTLNLADEIFIQSNNTVFCFSTEKTKKAMNIIEANVVPKIRIPFIIPKSEYINNNIYHNNMGFNNIFYYQNVNIELLKSEFQNIDKNDFIFLKNIENIKIDIDEIQLEIQINRKSENIEVKNNAETTEWKVIGNDQVKLGLLMKDKRIIECNTKDSFYHAFLPTMDECAFRVKINGDFSTDPSRKHITMDEASTTSLIKASEIIFDFIKSLIQNNDANLENVLKIFNTKKSFLPINNILAKKVEDLFKTNWLEKENNTFISPNETYVKPSFIDISEWEIIIKNDNTDKFKLTYGKELSFIILNGLNEYAEKELNVDDWLNILSNENIINNLPLESIQRIYSKILKIIRNNNLVNKNEYDLNNLLIRVEDSTIRIKIATLKEKKFFFNGIKHLLTESENEWILKEFKFKSFISEKGNNVDSNISEKKYENYKSIKFNIGNVSEFQTPIYKWRSAENQCLELEKRLGNYVEDVSKQNLGYDLISTDKYGKIKYIEVKYLKNRYSGFSITNNEYTTAHINKNNYYICLVYNEGENVCFEYLSNPIENLSFQKVVRQWEWVCEEYDGEVVSIKLE